MPQIGTITNHPQRAEIDAAILAGVPNRRIATRWNVSEAAIRRYRAGGFPAALARGKDAGDIAHADDLLVQLATLQASALRIGTRAEAEGDLRTALAAVRELVRVVELLAELQGELSRQPQINVLISPEWVEVRAVVLAALAPYPDARAAVAGALTEGGGM